MGIPDHLTYLLRNLYAGQDAIEVDMEQQTGFKLWRKRVKAVYCHPAYLTYIQSTSWEMMDWMKHKLESRLPGAISITWYADDTTLMAESKEELKSLLMKVKDEREKSGLKLNIQKTKIMASSPITSWQIDVGTMETVTDFIFLVSKITGMTEYEMVGWHHQLNGHEFVQTQGNGEGQGSLVCCSPWDHKELDTTEQLKNNKN